jgi:hypothetical protein
LARRTTPAEIAGLVEYWPGPMVCRVMSTPPPTATETVRPLSPLVRLSRAGEGWLVPQPETTKNASATTALRARRDSVPRLIPIFCLLHDSVSPLARRGLLVRQPGRAYRSMMASATRIPSAAADMMPPA